MIVAAKKLHQAKASTLPAALLIDIKSTFGCRLTHGHALNTEQRGQLPEFWREMTNANCAVVRRSMFAPLFNKAAHSDREAVTAIGVADFKNWPGNRFALRHDELQGSPPLLLLQTAA